jgi:hypothetical protein
MMSEFERRTTLASAQIVTYRVDDQTTVEIEIDPSSDYLPAGVAANAVSWVREAAAPALKAARVVLEQAQLLSPDDVTVRFGLRASGRTNWVVARAATEGTFEAALTWRRDTSGAA